jgi:ribosomal protein S24E
MYFFKQNPFFFSRETNCLNFHPTFVKQTKKNTLIYFTVGKTFAAAKEMIVIQSPQTLFIIPTYAHYYKSVEKLKQFKSYNTCPDMFRFTQEPSSGSSRVIG